jgi:hypothetical protein
MGTRQNELAKKSNLDSEGGHERYSHAGPTNLFIFIWMA